MGSKHKLITVPLDVLEAALEELPEGSAAAVRILKALEETPSKEPLAYLAQRRDGKQGGRFFATQPGRHYDPQFYRGPIPVYAGPIR